MPLLIVWPEVGMVAAKLLLSLSILVILHEFGHFITARWFKCRVEKFYLFFDPYFSIFKKKIGETEYGIGWLPLGGYVKIAGMVDESMDTEELAKPPKPDEFRSKPAWQRLIIMLGGVTMNVIVAFVIYAMILMVWGESHIVNSSLKNGISFTDPILTDMGFKNGDKILAVDNKSVEYFEDIPKKMILGNTNVTIERNGTQQIIPLPADFIGQFAVKVKEKSSLMDPRIPTYVGEVVDSSNAFKAGLKVGDKIIAVDSVPVSFYDDLTQELSKHKNQLVKLSVDRNGTPTVLNANVSPEGTIGFRISASGKFLDSLGVLKIVEKKYGFFESFPAGVKMAIGQLSDYATQFKKMVTPKTGAYKAVGGFGRMASIFPKTEWDWESFWKITAFFSIALAFMNLLPIPALDGGHVLFTLIEMVSGRKPNQKFMEYAQVVGMILLLSLMLYANGNDIFSFWKHK